MKIPILPVVALLSLLALHAAQGASLGHPTVITQEDTAYPSGTEAFKSDDFLNWHAITDMFKKALPFINWEFFPKVKGLRSIVPDSQ
ncbi:keratinocyte differentiation-associated protein [Apodemus sylvaticus]|uniref:keratinocyte differentiation-associated protein n=1 Tax=Apodemus sylvaticus TaxID=10129 RepID=UPI002241EB65|nr:keratinocyte differentiation-associated protein [Apodemus sylvaticus]